MSAKPAGVVLWISLLGGILSLTGEGGPDKALAKGKDLSQSPVTLGDISEPAGSPGEAKVRQNLSYGNIPLYFVPNMGQVNEAARFYARASRYTLWLTADGLVFDRSVSSDRPDHRARPWERERAMGRVEEESAESRREVHRLVFMGANPEPEIDGDGGTGHIANYFIGSDPAKWRTNIATSRAAVYKELYPNIDLKVYGVEKQIEYDWLVKPGGDPEAIDFAYQDVLGTEIDADGDLIIRTELGEFRHRKPDAYHKRPDGIRESVEASFRTIGPDRYGFTVGRYDRTRPLVIDPVVLIYSTFLGGNGHPNTGFEWDQGRKIDVDSLGCAYVTGRTFSGDFPTRNAFQANGYGDAFVTKFNAAGDDLVYSTYLGGISADEGNGIAVDGFGCAYVTGHTISPDFPLRNPFQANLAGYYDFFISKFSADGSDLQFSTYLGGTDLEYSPGIAVDNFGCVYVAGKTTSSDFPTRNPLQATNAGYIDVSVTKLTAAGNEVIYSTYLGGYAEDSVEGIAIDSLGCVYVTGYTASSDFPIRNAFQSENRGGDAFVAKLSAPGDELLFSSFLGGAWGEWGYGIAVDEFGCAYVTGVTYSGDFPTRNAFQASNRGYGDAFVVKFTAAGNDITYSTYLGGSRADYPSAITADGSGCAYVTGKTISWDFPLRNPFQSAQQGNNDVFVAKFTSGGEDLIYSTYLGGIDEDYAHGIAVDSSGRVFVTGSTMSADFPTRGPFQSDLKGGCDAFVTKLDMGYVVTAAVSGAGGAVSPATQTVGAGDSATINIYPDTGYTIASITDNGGSVAVANPYVINNVREDHDVVVTFARVYTVTASVNGVGGSVNPPSQTVMAGGTATIDIYPDLGYHIGSIRDNGASVAVASPYVIANVQEDHSVVVTFANAPPTIKIINPTNGAKVCGLVSVKAEASDDLRVLKVAFLIDEQLVGEDAFAESTSLYTQAWDTRGYTFGTHRVKVVAFDEAGLTAEDAINVVVENVALTLQGQRLTESAWILKKPFIRLTIGIQNLGQVSVAKYIIYRKNGTGDFKAIKEIPGSEVTGPTYVWVDKSINKNQTYTYRVLALSSSGVALGVSNDITL